MLYLLDIVMRMAGVNYVGISILPNIFENFGGNICGGFLTSKCAPYSGATMQCREKGRPSEVRPSTRMM